MMPDPSTNELVECAWVQDRLPEVQVLHLPHDPAEFVRMFRELDAFATVALTSEDLTQGRLYSEEWQRKELQQSASTIEEFYASLEMRAEIRLLTSTTLTRTVQLIQKTNQFNLTIRRYTEADMRALSQHPASKIYTLSVRDRFGITAWLVWQYSSMKRKPLVWTHFFSVVGLWDEPSKPHFLLSSLNGVETLQADRALH